MTALRYPKDLDGSGSDYVRFDFKKYETPLKSGSNNSGEYNRSAARGLTPSDITKDAIVITMPNDIASNITGDWGSKGMGGLTRAAIGTVGNITDVLTSKTKLDLGAGIGNSVSGIAGGFAEDALRGLVNKMNETNGLGSNLTASDVLGLVSTYIINPNTELLYQGTSLRKHGYRFKMIAQSKEEAQDILKIANIFKKCAAPKGGDQTFLKLENRNFIGIPDVCQVTFHQSGVTGEHPYLPRYKVSAITSVGVDYITEGQYITFSGGEPIGVNLTLEFTELKLLFSDEIGTEANQYR